LIKIAILVATFTRYGKHMLDIPHREEIKHAWRSFVATGQCEEQKIPAPILRSWKRCSSRKLTLARLAQEQAQIRYPSTDISGFARSVMEDLYQFVDSPDFVIMLGDANGTMLSMVGDAQLSRNLEEMGLGLGSSWNEEAIGTNAIDLALREVLPIQTIAHEHYLEECHSLACSAAPFFDIDGQALGVLAIICQASTAHMHTLGMVTAAAQALDKQLRHDQLLAESYDHLTEFNAVLESMSDGVVLVTPQGTIRRINSRAEQLLMLSQRSAAGQRLEDLLELPSALRQAVLKHEELKEQELVFKLKDGHVAAICGVRQMHDRGQRHLGALITLRPSQSVHRLVQQVVGAQAQFSFSDIVGESEVMAIVRHQARIAANSSMPLTLYGEAGVGKHMLAQAIHNASSRQPGPFISVNCAALPRTQLNAELFGIEAIDSGPNRREGRPGKLELAQDGTLFLEEIGALPLDIQTDLLRVIETHHNIRDGGRRVVPINARIIVTSSSHLEDLVDEGRFRRELASCLGMIAIDLPPLHERGDDLLLLIGQILPRLNEQLGKYVVFEPEALEAMRLYNWPGNIRELEVTLEQLLHSTEKSVLCLSDLPNAIAQSIHEAPTPLSVSYNHAERDAIMRAARQAGGHVGLTADLLGISRATLWRKMRRLSLSRDDLAH
jgi:transcriptional regulator of acetoin/glycerol metabolism